MYNLGFQAKAQPFRELEEAHKNFRLSISQRMLYDDQQSKKRTASHLSDQRQQITALKPPPATVATNNNSNNLAEKRPNCYGASTAWPSWRHTNGSGGVGGSSSIAVNDPYPPAKKFRPYRDEEWARTGHRMGEEWPKTERRMDECNGSTAAAAMFSNDVNAFNGHGGDTETDAAMKIQTNNNNSAACAIASSLNSVYGDSNAYDYNGDATNFSESNASHYVTAVSETIVLSETGDCSTDGINIPPNFIRSAKNHHEPWMGALFLDEPDVNKICKYPRHLVYPGNGSEYSLEEIRARNYTTVIEAIKQRNRQREQALAEQQRIEQMRRAAEQEEQAARAGGWSSQHQHGGGWNSPYTRHTVPQQGDDWNSQHQERLRHAAEEERMRQAAEEARMRQAVEEERMRQAAEDERNRQAALAMQRAKAAEVERLRLAEQRAQQEQHYMQQQFYRHEAIGYPPYIQFQQQQPMQYQQPLSTPPEDSVS